MMDEKEVKLLGENNSETQNRKTILISALIAKKSHYDGTDVREYYLKHAPKRTFLDKLLGRTPSISMPIAVFPDKPNSKNEKAR